MRSASAAPGRARIAGVSLRAVALAALLAGTAWSAGDRAFAAEKPSIEPRAEQVLRAALARLASARSLTFRAEVMNESVLPSGQRIDHTATLMVAARRPNAYWSHFEGETRDNQFWYDGKTFTLYKAGENVYASQALQESLDNLFDKMQDQLGFKPALAALLHEDVEKVALSKLQVGFVVGRGVVLGNPCHHLAFRGENSDWQIWIDEGPQPVIRRVLIADRKRTGEPEYSATFFDWDLNPQLGDYAFAFSPPPGATRIEFGGAQK